MAGTFGNRKWAHILTRSAPGARRAKRTATLRDRPLDQTFRQRGNAQLAHGDRPGGLAEDRHLVGIAAKCGDVLLDPCQRRDHIEQAVISGNVLRRLRAQPRMREKAEGSQTISDAYQHNSLLGQLLSAISWKGSSPDNKSAAINPHQNRDFCRG